MPQEHKKRGRRMKRKHVEDDEGAPPESSSKRQRSGGDEVNGYCTERNHDATIVSHEAPDESMTLAHPAAEKPFFGMLDADEQEHFKQAYEQLDPSTFAEIEDPDTLVANVYKDAEGKELKIAQSQSCSRLMERLIQLSSASQLKKLFQAFSGNFIHLISHRFASHCCEALFMRAAPFVTNELLAPATTNGINKHGSTSLDDVYVSMENLFLHTLAELEDHVGFLMTDSHASHALRVLLLVLAGEPFETAETKHLVRSKRKQGSSNASSIDTGEGAKTRLRTVPKSFGEHLEKVITASVAGLDTDKLRALATHPQANPTLQLLLKLELTHFGKARAKDETSIIKTLLPDDPITAESGSAIFINGIVYDAVGSHLVEQIIRYAPGKTFKSLYRDYFKERMASLARNEIAGYVVCRILQRLSKDDLYDVHETLVPVVHKLLERNRTMVISTLIERCAVRELDTTAIAAQLSAATPGKDGFNVKKFLKLEPSSSEGSDTPSDIPRDSVHGSTEAGEGVWSAQRADPAIVHFNLLAQAMLRVPGPLSSLILDSLIALDSATLQQMVSNPVITRTVQAALSSKNASIIQKRKLVQLFYGHIGEMALDKSASHVVDCIWEGTHGLAFMRERIAEELAENEAALRESGCGRGVWKNWKMDLYKRKRAEWIRQSKIKASNDGFQSFSELDQKKEEKGSREKVKTALELARERHAKKQKKKERDGQSAKGSNSSGSGRRSNRRITIGTGPAAAPKAETAAGA